MSRRIVSVGYDHAALTLRDWVLERAGYTVLPANSKRRALKLLQQESCDLVVVAGNIPKADLLQIVRASGGRMPVLWLFSGSHEDLPGISAYMPLLDGPEELLNNVHQLLVAPRPMQTAGWHPFLAKQQQHPKRRA
jgi:CheY-like chemotaxis protein